MTNNVEIMARVASVAKAWQRLRDENNGQLTDEQIDFVTDVAIDQISKIIAESAKA